MSKTHIKDRIVQALQKNGGTLKYYDLAREVFPKDQYPNAWGYPNKGGPPGCYMALSKAIRVYEFSMFDFGNGVVHTTVGYGKNRPKG